MNQVQMFVIIAVNTLLLLLRSGDASPIGNFNASTTTIHTVDIPHPIGSHSPSDCDIVHPYCCNPPLNSPSIVYLYDELNSVINLLEPACTNNSLKDNVSNKRTIDTCS